MTAQHPLRHRVFQVTGLYPPSLGSVQAVARQLAQRHDVEVVTTSCGADRTPRRVLQCGVRIRRFWGVVVSRTPLSLGLMLRRLMIPRDAIVHMHVGSAFVPEMVHLTSFLVEQYGIDRQMITMIPNGVDAEFFSQRTEFVDGPLRLLSVVRLDVQKNSLRMVEAMSNVSADVDLVVVGDGELCEATARRVAESCLSNVRLVGPARGGELLDWYSWADAFVLASNREGMPRVLLEAMAAELAFIVTDVPGTREAVGGVGLLTPPDPVALGAAIDGVAVEAGLIERLCASRSIEAAGEYRWESRLPQVERIYDLVARS